MASGKVEARALLTLRHEFPDRLQHHDYFPGEPPRPASGLLNLSPESSSPGLGDAGWPGVSPLSPAASACRTRAQLREGVGFAAACSLAVRRSAAAVRAPLILHFSSHPTPPPSFLSIWGRGQVALGLRAGAAEGSCPQSPPKLWATRLNHGLGKSVVPGAECATRQSGWLLGTREGFVG